jgi:hypothetical protein
MGPRRRCTSHASRRPCIREHARHHGLPTPGVPSPAGPVTRIPSATRTGRRRLTSRRSSPFEIGRAQRRLSLRLLGRSALTGDPLLQRLQARSQGGRLLLASLDSCSVPPSGSLDRPGTALPFDHLFSRSRFRGGLPSPPAVRLPTNCPGKRNPRRWLSDRGGRPGPSPRLNARAGEQFEAGLGGLACQPTLGELSALVLVGRGANERRGQPTHRPSGNPLCGRVHLDRPGLGQQSLERIPLALRRLDQVPAPEMCPLQPIDGVDKARDAFRILTCQSVRQPHGRARTPEPLHFSGLARPAGVAKRLGQCVAALDELARAHREELVYGVALCHRPPATRSDSPCATRACHHAPDDAPGPSRGSAGLAPCPASLDAR